MLHELQYTSGWRLIIIASSLEQRAGLSNIPENTQHKNHFYRHRTKIEYVNYISICSLLTYFSQIIKTSLKGAAVKCYKSEREGNVFLVPKTGAEVGGIAYIHFQL